MAIFVVNHQSLTMSANHISSSAGFDTLGAQQGNFHAASDAFETGSLGLPRYDEHLSLFPSGELPLFSLESLLVGLSVGLLLVALVCMIGSRRFQWWVARKNLVWWFMPVWLFCFVVYDIGQYTGNPWSLLGNAPMAVLHAFEAFLLGSDVSAIHEPFHNNWCFMLCFGLSHCMAAVVSMLFVLKYFGYNIIAGLRMFWAAWGPCTSKNTTYVFWGINEAAWHMAESIKAWHRRNGGESFRLVVVRGGVHGADNAAQGGLERLLGFLSVDEKEMALLQKTDCLATGTYGDIAESAGDAAPGITVDLLAKGLGLKTLARIIRRKTSGRLLFFFLSDDERDNILSTVSLKKDSTLDRWLAEEPSRKVSLYCHARYNGLHRVIEDNEMKSRIEVNVVDSSHISVELLKKTTGLQPVDFVKVEADATVSSPFNALVVGFSEVGQDSVRFLYEFGAFVKTGSTDDDVRRSDFHCHVVDRNMADLAGAFVANAPEISPSLPFVKDGVRPGALLTLHKMDCRSVEFYRAMEGWIKDLNYVVIATDDDELNMTLGIRLFRLAIRYRRDMERLCILVRIHDDDEGHFQRVADHYNRLWEAELNSDSKNKRHQSRLKTGDACSKPIIRIFGLDNRTYTYENVIQEDTLAEAKRFKARYDKAMTELKKISGETDPAQLATKDWDEEVRDLMQLEDFIVVDGQRRPHPYKDCVPTYTAVMRLRRTQNQNLANCLHLATKRRLASLALGDAELRVFDGHHLLRREGTLTYVWKDYVRPDIRATRVLDVLAQTEHLRWNAAHEILGYRSSPDEGHTDEAALVHGCIRPWQGLSARHKSYDYNVVDMSLGIIGVKD